MSLTHGSKGKIIHTCATAVPAAGKKTENVAKFAHEVEREKERQLSLILFNVPEATEAEEKMSEGEFQNWKETNKKKDKDGFLEISKMCQTAITPGCCQTVRLGAYKPNQEKPRPIKVTLTKLGQKTTLFTSFVFSERNKREGLVQKTARTG